MSEHLQPWENIIGEDRPDDKILSLDGDALPLRRLVMTYSRHFDQAVRVWGPAPIVEKMHKRTTTPLIGDLVVEIGGCATPKDERAFRSMGILIEKRVEWWESDEEWQLSLLENTSMSDNERSVDVAWYVQYGQNKEDITRWVDCSFTAVPTDLDFFGKVGSL